LGSNWPVLRHSMIIETKHYYDGRTKTFECECLEKTDTRLIVLHIVEADTPVGSLIIPKGTISFGVFWLDRPYNTYIWVHPSGEIAGYYFNISDSTAFHETKFEWRDLIVDVLVLPSGEVELLDHDELPPNAPAWLIDRISDAEHLIVSRLDEIVGKLAAIVREFIPDTRAETSI